MTSTLSSMLKKLQENTASSDSSSLADSMASRILNPEAVAKAKEAAKEADHIWKMLDDMAENDPEAYEKFVKEKAGDVASTRAKCFTPKAGLVLKGYTLRGGSMLKLFINVCSHPGVQTPLAANGKPLGDDAPGWAARQIPLLVGALRETRDKKGVVCLVVDVVFSPWVLKRLGGPDPREEEFKQQVADLAASWVKDEHGLGIHSSSYKYIRSVYKGGTGDNNIDPVPFSLDEHPVSAEGMDKEEGGETKATASSSSSPSASRLMQSPGALLTHMRRANEEEEKKEVGGAKKTTRVGSERGKRKPLIQEIGIKEVSSSSASSKKKKKKKPAVRKGFLNRCSTSGERKKNSALLYPTGSSEGEVANPYPWANVVDTRSMSKEKLQRTMAEYGESGSVTSCDEHVTKASRAPGRKSGDNAPRDSTSSSASSMPTSREVDELERLMELADPETRSSARSGGTQSGRGAFGSDKFVSDLNRVLKLSNDPDVVALGRSLERRVDVARKERVAEESSTVEDASTTTVVEGGMKRMLLQQHRAPQVPVFSLDTSGKREIVVKVELPLLEGGLADVDLDINETHLRLRHAKYRLDVPLPESIDPAVSKARFSKRRRELKVRLGRKGFCS
eukprot:g996.t1